MIRRGKEEQVVRHGTGQDQRHLHAALRKIKPARHDRTDGIAVRTVVAHHDRLAGGRDDSFELGNADIGTHNVVLRLQT